MKCTVTWSLTLAVSGDPGVCGQASWDVSSSFLVDCAPQLLPGAQSQSVDYPVAAHGNWVTQAGTVCVYEAFVQQRCAPLSDSVFLPGPCNSSNANTKVYVASNTANTGTTLVALSANSVSVSEQLAVGLPIAFPTIDAAVPTPC
jgi:hypothetical protein